MRPNVRRVVNARVQQELRRAHALMEHGDHINAAVIFNDLAEKALDRDMLQPGTAMLLRAGQAYILGGEVQSGAARVRRALEILAEGGNWGRVYHAGQQAVATLNESGHKDEAQKLQDWLDKALAGHDDEVRQAKSQMADRRNLPAKCPYCGATVKPDEVNWYPDGSVECAYCGSTVQSED